MEIKIRKQRWESFSAFILGVSSVISQVVLMRELVTVFYGNETVYAIILAVWLFWVAAGSLVVGAFGQWHKRTVWPLVVIQSLLYICLPATVFASRCIKQFMHIQTGEIIGIIPAFISIFLLLAPSACLFGAMFALLCRLSVGSNGMNQNSEGISSIYLWESAGAGFGGILLGFILIRFLSAAHIIFFVGMLNLCAGLIFAARHTAARAWLIMLVVSGIVLYRIGWVSKYDRLSRRIQWQGTEIVHITDSVYGNIALTRIGAEYSLFENGLFSFSTRDDASAETSVHYAMLAHPSPHNVLLIGGGIGGAVREILKHPVCRLDYVELDSKVISISKEYLPEQVVAPLDDNRVRIVYMDGRMFVKSAEDRYDVIIINLSDPLTAMVNRYYTLEFFQEARKILAPDGILSLSVSSSENYLSDEQRRFLRSVYSTLGQVFPDIKVVPMDTAVFIACTNKGFSISPDVLVDRLKDRKINTRYVREYYLPYQLSSERIWQMQEILKEKGEINTDIRPVSYLYDILLWSTHFNTAFKSIFSRLRHIKPYHLFLLPLFIFICGFPFARKRIYIPVSLSILTTGFSEIIFQVIVIIAFQSLYGYAYYKISIIIASFMFGLLLGSLLAKKIIASKQYNIFSYYKFTQFAICIYPMLLPIIFIVFRDISPARTSGAVFASIFASLPVISGIIGGMQYPVAAYLLSLEGADREGKAGSGLQHISRYAGILYAIDSLGAAIGAIIAATFLIPVFGISITAILCSALNFAIFLLLMLPNASSMFV